MIQTKMMISFILSFINDLIILPLTLFATLISKVFDFRAHDLRRFDPKRKSVILLHGSGNNESEWLFGRLFLQKFNVFSFNYAGLFSNKSTDGIDDYSFIVRREIDTISLLTGCKTFIIIGHSMGGLIGGHYLYRYSHLDYIKGKVISISSPWNGSPLAGLKDGKRYEQMSVGSSFMSEMKSHCKSECIDIYSITSDSDWAVPKYSGVYDPQKHTRYNYLGHYSIIVSYRVWCEIQRLLEKD